jgi:hypothetical protein
MRVFATPTHPQKLRRTKSDDLQENYREMQQQKEHNEQAEKYRSVITHVWISVLSFSP